MQDVRAGPRHSVEDDQPQAPPRHVDPVPQRVGAEQAGVGLGAEDIDQRRGVEGVHMLGPERDAGLVQRACDPLVDRAQPRDRGKQAERSAAGRGEERAIGRCHPVGRVPRHVGDHKHAGLRAVVEGGGESGPDRRRLQMAPARRRLRPAAQSCSASPLPSLSVAEVMSAPWERPMTNSAKGMVGST